MRLAAGRPARAADADALSIDGAPAAATAVDALTGERADLALYEGSFAASALASPGLYDVEWEGGAARVERVAAHMFTLAEMREAGGDEDALYDASDGPLEEARARAVQVVERACRRAFCPVAGVSGPIAPMGGGLVELPWCDVSRIVWARDASGGRVAAVLAGDCFAVVPAGAGSVSVAAVHGMPWAPDEVRDAALRLSLYYLRRPVRPDNAVGQSTDYGYIRFSLAGRDGTTGLPEVDAAIKAWARLGRSVA